MGDGGVACMPLQQHIMERLPNGGGDKTLCGGGGTNGNNNNNNNGFNSKLLKLPHTDQRKKKMKSKKSQAERSEFAPDGVDRGNDDTLHVENVQKEEMEEGELGTMKWSRSDVENGEFGHGKWRRDDVEKGEIVMERSRRGEADNVDDYEKGEFIPDRWQREVGKDDYGYSRGRRYQPGRDKGWKSEREFERTPPSGRYAGGEGVRKKEFNRNGGQHAKNNPPRWEGERNVRISSMIVDEDKNEHSNGRNYAREYSVGSRLKRHSNDSDSSERKHYEDYSGLKSRRLSDDSCRPVYPEHYSHRSAERAYRNPSKTSADKHSRNYESSLPARPAYERHGSSPAHSERSPRESSRYYDHRDRTPVRRERSPHGRDKSPYVREKSPHGRDRSPYIREISPYGREKSPYEKVWDKSRYNDHKTRSPTHAERSPQDRRRHQDRRDRTPNLAEQQSFDRPRLSSIRENNSKMVLSEKHETPHKDQEDKHVHRESNCSVIDSHSERDLQDVNGSIDRDNSEKPEKEKQPCSPTLSCKESPHIEPLPEEPPSMEEDMDICDTPPHVPLVADLSSTGKWFYLDYNGVENGPSKLSDIKVLVNEGILMSDHFVKHQDSDRWMTAENAASPLAAHSFPSIVSDSITQLVNPPEAPGNLLIDTGDSLQHGAETFQKMPAPLLQPMVGPHNSVVASGPLEEFCIDERVKFLLEGYDVIPGRETEAIKDALQMNFEYADWEGLGDCEGFPWHDNSPRIECDSRTDFASRDPESQSSMLFDKDNGYAFGDPGDWFSARWPCKGGDWKRSDDAQDRSSRKKLVLNDGFSLCEMPKSGCEDPRWPQKDDLYYPSQSRRLDLPPWAFCADERADSGTVSRTTQTKSFSARGVKGNVLPVVRINACVVSDQGSLVSEPRHKIRTKDRHHSRPSRPFSSSSDSKRSSTEEDSQSKAISDQSSCLSTEFVKTPKDRLCTAYDLQLHWGEWYYLDGSGRERGPSSYSELQILVDQGIIKKHCSVFRKWDKVWVPVGSAAETSDTRLGSHQESSTTAAKYCGLPLLQTQGVSSSETCTDISAFDRLHPQFIGYTRGKLHELVMKSYKSREFAAAINEALDPWINARQTKKENEKQLYWKSEDDARAAKRARILVDDSEEDSDMEDGTLTLLKSEPTFDDLCGDATFVEEESDVTDSEAGSWSLLKGHVLARVFHHLRSDLKSLVFSSLTCKHWRAAVMFYKEVSRQVNLSSLSHSCTDTILWSIMNAHEKDKIRSMVLINCTGISADMLEKILLSFPLLSAIDIRGCNQFNELTSKFPNVKWIKSKSSRIGKTAEELHKTKSLKQITEQTSYVSKTSNLGAVDDFGELKDYFDSVDKRDTAKQLFRRNLYKRSKLYDARRSSSILSRDARTRRWAIKKSENGYKRMEEFIVSGLREIMKENPCDFFVTKVAEIEAKMKTGYYSGRGLSSVKGDISRMCRDAMKTKNHGDAGSINHIITLFIQLATRLEESSKSLNGRDASLKIGEDDALSLFSSTSSKYRKNKLVTERRYKNNGARGSLDNGDDISDREIRRRLSKLNRKSFDSDGETSDDIDISSEDGKSRNETTTSDSESDSENRIGESRGDGLLSPDGGLDFITDDREWGARMTKASLVPPVTRKYEVIDHYVTVADEEDVQRKMRVSLPDDYAEKLNAQKNGTEESDMELPEVKDYKPRKQLGDEVIEQEVYGIDPYTHNLLLDSMPEELDWSIEEKHLFVEDILLRTLNKQVRHFTGTGSTPMSYPLQPVIDEIKKIAEKDCDVRMVRMCQGILKAIDSRPDDKYVAYRKGLGVVCGKEGFGEDDFVVEFLGEVYPVWKWFEKQDGIRSLQKNSTEPAPEFYNIYLERPKGDADGYDLVVVDAMHKANYASRICHSCRPNCEAKVTAVDGHYQIGIYTVRKILPGEEITFDYNSVTESKEEYEASVCLCGSQVCRGSYLNLTGEGAFQKVLKEWHGILDRHYLMLEACELNSVSEEDYNDLGRAGLGSCLLGGLPDWLVAYAARLVRFINIERTKLPEEILRHNLEEKRKYFSDICLEVERSDAEVQAEGVYNQRLQNLAVTLDKVRYVMRCIFGDPRKAPPPLEKLSPEAAVSFLWKGEDSFVEELLQCIAPHVEEDALNDLKVKIQSHDPSGSGDTQKELQKSLLWLRDEVRNLPCTYKSRHDAAADLIHIYAHTECFFRIREYEAITSPPVYISPLDLGPKYADKLGTGFQEYRKTYGENYCLGQLIFWHNQSNVNPDSSLARARRGCLSLPDVGSFYAKAQKPSRHRVYGPRTVRSMLARMEKQPQRPWPKDRIWSFKTSPKFLGSPMLDSVINKTPVDREMVHWLRHRRAVFHAMWDR